MTSCRLVAAALLATVALLSAGCTSSSTSPKSDGRQATQASVPSPTRATTAGPVAWSKAETTGFPATNFPTIVDSLYAQGRWYVAMQKPGAGFDNPLSILTSTDGVNWKDITPPLYSASNASQIGAPQNLLATDGTNVYLTGANDVGFQVWEGKGGTLDGYLGNFGYESASGNFVPVGIVAARGCIYTAVMVFPANSVVNGSPVLGVAAQQVDVWSACNGTLVASPATLSFASADLVGWTDVQLTADSHGAVLYAHDRQYRVSGDRLQPDGTFPGEPMLTVTNGHIVVAMQIAGRT